MTDNSNPKRKTMKYKDTLVPATNMEKIHEIVEAAFEDDVDLAMVRNDLFELFDLLALHRSRRFDEPEANSDPDRVLN